MKISRLIIKNYRNIKDIDICLNNIVAIIGENNSGKSNLLKAVTLPFLSDDLGYTGKTLSWADINNEAKSKYYEYILENGKSIKDESVDIKEFSSILPKVSVEVTLEPTDLELYFVKDLSYTVNEDSSKVVYGLLYEFFPKNPSEILKQIKEILLSEDVNKENFESVKMNLLPTNFYSHSIVVPQKRASVSYDTLKYFKYTSLIAERDDFSNTNEKLGSKSLVKLLQMKLDTKAKLIVEKEYTKFFDTLKNLSDMENVINWQESTELKNAKSFFNEISILPNMPPMNSLLNSVRLGYSGEQLSSQGLGYRNLILLLVLMNSLLDKKNDLAYSLLTMEEPEAHLCVNNTRLMVSFIKSFMSTNKFIQLFYSTHSTQFINKLDFNNVVVVNNGDAYALVSELNQEGKDYLSKNPNLDLFKLFFSKNCILVEGLTEELFIRAYLDSKPELNDIEVISFHKGFQNIMDIWLKINLKSKNKLGIIRDSDFQLAAQKEHEKYNEHDNICVRTTDQYTLEPEVVATGNNYELLKKYFEDKYSWSINSKEELSDKWRDSKSTVMLQLCKDLVSRDLEGFEMPSHIKEVLDFLNSK
jgi:predicted ATP-dependent endonuclease of OLD family